MSLLKFGDFRDLKQSLGEDGETTTEGLKRSLCRFLLERYRVKGRK